MQHNLRTGESKGLDRKESGGGCGGEVRWMRGSQGLLGMNTDFWSSPSSGILDNRFPVRATEEGRICEELCESLK